MIPIPETVVTHVSPYIDLGVASYAIQLLIAFLLGGFVTVGMFWKKVVGWFKRNKDSQR